MTTRSAMCWTCCTEVVGCVEVALDPAFVAPVAFEALAVFGALAARRPVLFSATVVVSLVLVDISLRCLKNNSTRCPHQLYITAWPDQL
jgi:hypothetical protein